MHSASVPPALGRVLAFIPSFNDAATLPDLAAALDRLGGRFRALVIDDGSTSPVVTADLAGRCLHVRLPANFGLGVCTHVAFSHVLRHGYDALVRLDADGQHDVGDITRLVAELEGGADVVIGMRVNQPGALSVDNLARRLMKRYFSAFATALTGGKLPRDVNTGLFALNRRAVEVLSEMTFERFPEPEIFIRAARAGLRIGAISVEQRPRKEGTTTLGLFAALQMFFRFNVFAIGELFRRRGNSGNDPQRWRTVQ